MVICPFTVIAFEGAPGVDGAVAVVRAYEYPIFNRSGTIGG